MKQADLKAKRGKEFKVTADSSHSYPVNENLLNFNFKANSTGQAWVSDITARAVPLHPDLYSLAQPYFCFGFSRLDLQ